MDKLLKTTIDSFCRYFNMSVKYGFVKQQDRINLFILYFLYYLKFNSDYIFDIDITNNTYHINIERVRLINEKFLKVLDCLKNNSCVIHDNLACFTNLFLFTPPADEQTIAEYPYGLVTNANNKYDYEDIENDLTGLLKYIVTNDFENIILENDDEEHNS